MHPGVGLINGLCQTPSLYNVAQSQHPKSDPHVEADRMRRSWLVVAAAVAMTGCATTAPVMYSKAGVTAEQRKVDDRDCVAGSIGSREGSRAQFFVPVDREAYGNCMVARGYRRSQ
jgi:hypothetical protein